MEWNKSDIQWSKEGELMQRIAGLEAERDRLEAALEANRLRMIEAANLIVTGKPSAARSVLIKALNEALDALRGEGAGDD